jgi:hypothetical protein
MIDATKLELILLKFANRVLDVKNGKENPTLGELVNVPLNEIMALSKEEANV